MVFGVCRRVLANFADAEDAFQATFLVLVRKAQSIRGERIGPWLYGVAFRVAMKARSRASRVAQRRAEATEMIPDSTEPTETPDWLPILDAELNALPAKYREPLVLCELQGTTRASAAKTLGIPEGTLSSRLARARELLRRRLLKHGTLLPAGGLTALFSANGVGRASVPAALIAKTSEMVAVMNTGAVAATAGVVPAGAARLTDEVLKSMFFMKLRVTAGALLMVALVAFGVSAWPAEAPGQQEQPRAKAAAHAATVPPAVTVPQADAKPETTRAANGRVSIKFTSPDGMKVAWQIREESPAAVFKREFKAETGEVTVPKECNFLQGQVYRLRLSQVSPKHRGKSFYPTIEVSPANPKTATFLAHACVPIAFTDEDFDQAANNNIVVKVIYLPERDNDTVADIDEVVSPRLEPGVDPVAEARRRGSILAVVRLGNIDLENKSPPAKVGTTLDSPNRFRGAGQELRVDGGTVLPDREALQGLWVLEKMELGKGAKPDEQKMAQEMNGKLQYLVAGDVWWGMIQGVPSGNLGPHVAKLDSTKNPKWLDLMEVELLTAHVGKWIYELDGEKLRICALEDPSRSRPAEFNLDDGYVMMMTFRRGKMPPAAGDKTLLGSWQGTQTVDKLNEAFNEKNFSITSTRIEILDGFLFAFVPGDPVTTGKWLGARYTVDTTKNPKWIDLELVEPLGEAKVTKLHGCYEVAEGRLKLALGTSGKRVFRPLELAEAKDVLFLDAKTTKEPLRPIDIEKMLREQAPQPKPRPKPELAPQPKPKAPDPDEEVGRLIREEKFAIAESRLRKLLPGAMDLQLAQRQLFLGICLVQLATKADLDQAKKLHDEAAELYRKALAIVATAPPGSKTLAAWIRTQAEIRTLQLLHLTGKTNELLDKAAVLLERHPGTVDELIALSLMFHAFKQKGAHDRALVVRDQMKELFVNLKDKPGAFSAEEGEYSRKYWEQVWFAEK
jgi:RNA polymerase sigma factor (sigma-70 family)